MTEKIQCPYKLKKHLCEFGQLCTDDVNENKGMPSIWNECSVAQRQLNGNPWRNERKVVYDKVAMKFEPQKLSSVEKNYVGCPRWKNENDN